MTDSELITQFESGATPESSFHHADHVRLGFAYLRQYPALEAVRRFCAALQRFAAARGKPGLYHETITHAYLFLIGEWIARNPGADWDEFASSNPGLLRWQDGILSRYYRESTLKSDLARKVFIFPDNFPV